MIAQLKYNKLFSQLNLYQSMNGVFIAIGENSVLNEKREIESFE